MSRYDLAILLPDLSLLVFFVAIGACVGSLINVLVYRLPRGIGVVTPPSACPACETRLTWRENIPVIGWLLLRGRCRFCRSPISPEYPIVEASVGLIFGLFFALWYMVPDGAVWLGVPVGEVRPEWAANGLVRTWPAFVVLLTLVGSLIAMTIIDARTFTIPLVLAWVPAAVAVVFHPLHALWHSIAHGGLDPAWVSATGEVWTLATPGLHGWGWIGAGIGGTLGLGVACLLLHFGILRRSFEDYEAWEREALEKEKAERASAPLAAPGEPEPGGEAPGEPQPPEAERTAGDEALMWIQYPHARREMVKEAAFLAMPAVGALAGWWGVWAMVEAFAGAGTFDPETRMTVPAAEAPLWLTVLGGVLVGYLVGGGVVWAVRLLGSLAFGKEAMGLGDVHLMAAVGACLGWIDSVIAFFGAAFVGVGWALISRLFSGAMQRAMPYGPFLAISTVLLLLFKPGVEWLLTVLSGSPTRIDLP